MKSVSASAALNSGVFARAITRSKPDGARSRAMSIALSGLSVSRIFGAILASWSVDRPNDTRTTAVSQLFTEFPDIPRLSIFAGDRFDDRNERTAGCRVPAGAGGP